MKYLLSLFCLGLMLNAFASDTHKPQHHTIRNEATTDSNIKILLEKAPSLLVANKPVTIRFQLLKDNKAMTLDELNNVHTKKIHVLVIDPSLSDYHHVHPVVSKNNSFTFSFIPQTTGTYRMWVDITPAQTNKQEFLMSNLGTSAKRYVVKKEESLHSIVSPYDFSLKLDNKPKGGQEVMATITVMKSGKPFTKLEPVMGAFAHLVGFSSDQKSILHIHPMGKEPSQSSNRGGPELTFHIAFKEKGFVKFFAQFRINGQDVYVPFGVWVD